VDNRFQPQNRIKTKSEFQSALQGKPVRCGSFAMYARNNQRSVSRLGLIVSRSVGNAVKRNRVKRLLREVFRRIKNHFAFPTDLVIRANPAILTLSYHQLYDEIAGHLHTSGLLTDEGSTDRTERQGAEPKKQAAFE
jgi:ribonuclease P protein component